MNKRTAISICIFGAILCECVEAQHLSSFSGRTMGTRYQVTVVGEVAPELQTKIHARLDEINALMSTYDAHSELSRFNLTRSTDWFAVSDETAQVVEFAMKVAKETDGAFDPTVGPAVNLWGFGPAGRRNQPPSNEDVAAIQNRIGYQQLAVRQASPALKKSVPEIYLDLSAVAKGYAVDELSNLLVDEGHESSLVVVGGEIYARGTKPDGSAWNIGIEEPNQAGKPVQRSVPLVDLAVSTSGDWRNSFQHDGARYSHVIDPRSAKPVTHDLASVTVFAASSMQADALSTALMVIGPEKGIQWCDAHRVAAMFFVRQENGAIEIRASQTSKSLESH